MWRNTGPGVVEVDTSAGPEPLRAKLANFNIDGDEVKQAHADFLLTFVVPRLQDGKGNIWMRGHASQTGGEKHNQDLSQRRVNNVAKLLTDVGIGANQMQLKAVGEGMSIGPNREDPSDRAVVLVVWPREKDDPPPPPEVPPLPKTNLRFQIKQHMNVNAGKVVVGDFSIFQIWDVHASLTSFYTFSALGGGFSPIPLWLSGTLPGPWNDLFVSKALAANAFGGAARFTTGGGGGKTVNYLDFMGLPAGFRTIPSPAKIETGFTLGVGGSSTVGRLTLQKLGTRTGLLPFTGP